MARKPSKAGSIPTNLGAPAQRALSGAGIFKLVHLTRFTESEIRGLHGMEAVALEKLRIAMDANGVSFAPEKKSPG